VFQYNSDLVVMMYLLSVPV